MKHRFFWLAAVLALAGCKDEKKVIPEAGEPEGAQQETTIEAPSENNAALTFRPEVYTGKSSVCKAGCSKVSIKTAGAVSGAPGVADSINAAEFRIARSIIYFGEKPTNARDYKELMNLFIKSYDDLAKKYPEEADRAWEATINTSVVYQSDNIINLKINNYLFTGGAHGYEGNRSLLVDAKTGKTLKYPDIINDIKGFTAFAEKKFRQKFKIPAGKNINSTGLMFEKDRFALPQNIFFSKEGITLYYNAYEIASYAEQQKELLIPYSEADKFLKIK